jgi:hypothetical protein
MLGILLIKAAYAKVDLRAWLSMLRWSMPCDATVLGELVVEDKAAALIQLLAPLFKILLTSSTEDCRSLIPKMCINRKWATAMFILTTGS